MDPQSSHRCSGVCVCVSVCEHTQECVLSVHNGSASCAHNAPAESSRALLLNREREREKQRRTPCTSKQANDI